MCLVNIISSVLTAPTKNIVHSYINYTILSMDLETQITFLIKTNPLPCLGVI